MSLQNLNNNLAYGFSSPLIPIINPPIIADRAPTVNDIAELGSEWVDTVNGDVYFLTKVEGSAATWTAASGNGAILTSLTVNPGPTVISGDLTVNGTNVGLTATATMSLSTTGAGVDIDMAAADGSIVMQASEDAANAIFLQADGGINATIVIENTLGTGLDAITISAPAGGIDLDVGSIDILTTSVLTIAAGTDLTLSAGSDVFVAGTDTVQIEGAGAFANAILLNATDVASGIDVNAGSSGITVDTTGGISLDSAAASNFTVAGAFDLTLRSTAGSIVITGDQAAADAVQINALSGGGIDMNAGILGATIDSADTISLGAGAASDFTVTGAFDLDLASTLGAVNISSGQIAVDAIVINASAGGMQITSDNMVLDATQSIIRPTTSLTFGTAATVSTVDVVNITPTVARTTTVNGGAVNTAVIDLVSIAPGGVLTDAGAEKEVTIATGTTAVGTTTVSIATGNVSAAGTTNLNMVTGNAPVGTTQVVQFGTGTGGGTKQINIGGTDSLTTINEFGVVGINATTGTGATSIGNTTAGGAVAISSLTTVTALGANVNINNSGTGATTIGSAATGGAIALDSVAASNFTVTGAAPGVDLTLSSVTGNVIVSGGDAVANAVQLSAAAGGITITTAAASDVVLTGGNLEVASATKGIILGSGLKVVDGAGSPDTAVTATKGSLYLRTDGSGVNDRAYINTDGATAWTAIVTVA